MRKLGLIAIIFIFASFTNASGPGNGGVNISTEIVQADGMTYRVFKGKAQFDNHIDIEVVNVTKEKLEIERLKAEIEYYKKIR